MLAQLPFFAAGVLSTSAFSQNTWWPANTNDWYQIATLHAGEYFESISVTFANGAAPNPANCGYVYAYVVAPTNPKRRELWQPAQLAFATGKPVRVMLNGCITNGGGTVPVITNLILSN